MDIATFIDNMKEQFDDLNEDLKPETVFSELDSWSSLTALSVIAMVDEEYEVTLKGADIRNARTVQDLFNTVLAKKA